MGKRHRKPAKSAEKVAKVGGVLAFTLSVGAAVVATPGEASAAPGDRNSAGSTSSTSSSSSVSDSRKSARDSRKQLRRAARAASSNNSANPVGIDNSADPEANFTSPQAGAANTAKQTRAERRAARISNRTSQRGTKARPAVELAPDDDIVAATDDAQPNSKRSEARKARKAARSGRTKPNQPAEVSPASQPEPGPVEDADNGAPTGEFDTTPEKAAQPVSVSTGVADELAAATSTTPASPERSDSPTDVDSQILAGVGPGTSDPNDPQVPVESPALLAMLALARRRADEGLSTFGRMFPVGEDPNALPALNQLTDQQLADLAQTMLEEEPVENPKGTGAGLTFFGQFIDHDMTLDLTAQPSEPVDVEGILNERTFSFDLDSVYGGGPTKSPQLYDGDKFLLGTAADGVSPDLPRDENGSAIIGDARNDENLIVSQIHLSFLRLHNALVDEGMSFEKAEKTVVSAYQHVVLNDYLPQIVGQDAVDQALSQSISGGFYDPGSKDAPINPVEFSTAAFRFGHSQVRNGYAINDTAGGLVFSPNPAIPDLRGGRQLPEGFVIDFNNFFGELPRDSEEDPAQVGMAIDTQISQSLFQLPIPGAAGSGSNVLAFRNMVRGKFYDLPSGEAVAEAMGLPVVGEPVFEEGTPLWYYALREAELTSGGAELGPVGGAIVAEVFVDLLRIDGAVRNDTDPRLPDVSGGEFQIGDLLVAADQLEAGGPPKQGPKPRPGRDKGAKRDRGKERAERSEQRRERKQDRARGRSSADRSSL